MDILPRIIRLRDAPNYFGMNKNYFNAAVRPCLTEIPIGDKGVGFDRLELDTWVAYTKDSSGRPAKRRILWDATNNENQPSQGSANEMRSGGWKKWSTANELEKVLAQVTMKKR